MAAPAIVRIDRHGRPCQVCSSEVSAERFTGLVAKPFTRCDRMTALGRFPYRFRTDHIKLQLSHWFTGGTADHHIIDATY